MADHISSLNKQNKMKEIGTVTMEYDIDGNVIPPLSSFKPLIEVSVAKIADQLKNIKNSSDPEVVKFNATMILSLWFSEVTNVELADREEFTLNSEVVECVKYSDGKIKKCVIKFILN